MKNNSFNYDKLGEIIVSQLSHNELVYFLNFIQAHKKLKSSELESLLHDENPELYEKIMVIYSDYSEV